MAVTNYLWDVENDSYLTETDGTNATQAVYTNEPTTYGSLLSQRQGSNSSYYSFDSPGSVRQLTDPTANITDTYVFTAFGDLLITSGTTTNTFRFAGQSGYFWDQEVGTYYVRARTYSPAIGQFTSRDPLGNSNGHTDLLNFYAYVRGNPVLTTDPSGLSCSCGETARCIWVVGLSACLTGYGLKLEADTTAENSGLEGAHNGPQDAFRHCYWSCRMTQELDKYKAKNIGNNHEECVPNPPGETCMDKYNNRMGREIGDQVPNGDAAQFCADECHRYISLGKLQHAPGCPEGTGTSK